MHKLTLTAAVLASAALIGLATPRAASAHFAATCSGVGTVTLHFNGAPHAYVPLQIVGTTSILVPLKVVENGDVIVDQSFGVERSAVDLTTCSFALGDNLYEVTGVLGAANP